MTRESIKAALAYLPANSLLYRTVGVPDGPNFEVDRLNQALKDPAFAFNYVKSFVDAGLPYPLERGEHYLKLIYAHLSRRTRNADITEALTYRLPDAHIRQAFLQGALLAKDSDIYQISEICNTSPMVIALYERLFFCVRDRMNDREFISNIVWPHTATVKRQHNYFLNEDPGNLLLRAGYESGFDALLKARGIKTRPIRVSLQVGRDQLTNFWLEDAIDAIKMGAINQSNQSTSKIGRLMEAQEAAGNQKTDASDLVMGIAGAASVDRGPGSFIVETVEGLRDNSDFHLREAMKSARAAAAAATKN